MPLLNLLMDQGPVGTASFSFLKSCHVMVHADWDFYHRLKNQMNLAGSKNQLAQAQLACQYAWSVNYRPYGSGQFFGEKEEALRWFRRMTSVATWFGWTQHLFFHFVLFLMRLYIDHQSVLLQCNFWNFKKPFESKSN